MGPRKLQVSAHLCGDLLRLDIGILGHLVSFSSPMSICHGTMSWWSCPLSGPQFPFLSERDTELDTHKSPCW